MTSSHRMQVICNHLYGYSQISTKRTSSSSKYRYTLDNNVLTNEQRAFYEENGYLVIRNLIDHCLIDECRNRFIDICNGKVETGQIIVMKDKSLMNTDAKGEYLINKIQDILFDDVLEKYPKNPTLLKYIECFTGPKITAIHSHIINKPPNNGGQSGMHPMHQDLYYLPIRPAERIVTSWTAMEKITVTNGCLFVVPGSHKRNLQPHDYPKYNENSLLYEMQGSGSLPRVNLEMDKGDTVFFHPLLFHGSGSNMTTGLRCAIACHYASSDCNYCHETDIKVDAVQKDLKKTMKAKGLLVSYWDAFRYRQRLIKGKPGSLQQL